MEGSSGGITNLNSRSGAEDGRKKSFKDVVNQPLFAIAEGARFVSLVSGGPCGEGKDPNYSLESISIAPNKLMCNEISTEKNRLKDTMIFFAIVDIDKCLAKKFLDDWSRNI